MSKTTLFAELCLVHIYGGDYTTAVDVKLAEEGRPAFAVITLKARDDAKEGIVIYDHRLWVVRAADKTDHDSTDLWKKFRTPARVQVMKAGDREYINLYPIEEHRSPTTVRHELRIEQNLPEPEAPVEEIGVLVSRSRAGDLTVRAAIWTLAEPAVIRPNVPMPKKPQPTRGRLIAPPALPKAKATAELKLAPTPEAPAESDAPTAQAELAQA
jgi:hypothetical protein